MRNSAALRAFLTFILTSTALGAAIPSSGACAGRIQSYFQTVSRYVQFGWSPPLVDNLDSLGAVHIEKKDTTPGVAIDIPIAIRPTDAPLRLKTMSCSSDIHNPTVKISLTGSSSAEVVLVFNVKGPEMSIDISAENLAVASLNTADWPAALGSEKIPVPYYSGDIVYLPSFHLFANRYLDWHNSNATELSSTGAVYGPLTNARRNRLHERVVFSVSPNIDDVFPAIGNPKSPYMDQVAGRTVIDIRGGQFDDVAEALGRLEDYGVKNCVVLIHSWQHSGYDNGLPGHYPANPSQGGEEGLRKAVAAGEKAGCLVGLHENYVDYYPNYAAFTTQAIALTSDNKQAHAWFNASKGIQSFATKPMWILKNAATQSPEIHKRYKTDASFIDVNSAVVPWWHADMDANDPGAGMFSAYAKASVNLWNFERRTYGGPVFGEGLNHWFWSGLLDGVEAQFGASGFSSRGNTQPLFVDFDLLKIHPLQVNHGMGYYERWLPKGENLTRTVNQDAYRLQEIVYGHAPYISGEIWSNPYRTIQEQDLVSPVAKRYGTETATAIHYQVNGNWADSNAATKARDWSRVEVKYANGDAVVGNAQQKPLVWEGFEVPPYGWVAKGSDLLAYTAVRGGVIVDYSETASTYFANARNQSDLTQSGTFARPVVKEFRQTGYRSASFRLEWQVLDESESGDLKNFVHFVTGGGGISFQADRSPSVPTSRWRPGQKVEDGEFEVRIGPAIPDGDYPMRIGLYSPKNGERVPLSGADDGQQRYTMGDLIVSDGGSTLRFRRSNIPSFVPDGRLNSQGTVIDFGPIRTDGMVSLVRSGSNWILRVFPRSRDVSLQLRTDRFKRPSTISCDSAEEPASPVDSGSYWQVHAHGAKVCQWPAN